jgi:hypothetical protein
VARPILLAWLDSSAARIFHRLILRRGRKEKPEEFSGDFPPAGFFPAVQYSILFAFSEIFQA